MTGPECSTPAVTRTDQPYFAGFTRWTGTSHLAFAGFGQAGPSRIRQTPPQSTLPRVAFAATCLLPHSAGPASTRQVRGGRKRRRVGSGSVPPR